MFLSLVSDQCNKDKEMSFQTPVLMFSTPNFLRILPFSDDKLLKLVLRQKQDQLRNQQIFLNSMDYIYPKTPYAFGGFCTFPAM